MSDIKPLIEKKSLSKGPAAKTFRIGKQAKMLMTLIYIPEMLHNTQCLLKFSYRIAHHLTKQSNTDDL